VVLSESERAEVAKEFPEHLAKMRYCLQQAGHRVPNSDITLAWASYSDSFRASWLAPLDNDTELTQILLAYLPPARSAGGGGEVRLALEEADMRLAVPYSRCRYVVESTGLGNR